MMTMIDDDDDDNSRLHIIFRKFNWQKFHLSSSQELLYLKLFTFDKYFKGKDEEGSKNSIIIILIITYY